MTTKIANESPSELFPRWKDEATSKYTFMSDLLVGQVQTHADAAWKPVVVCRPCRVTEKTRGVVLQPQDDEARMPFLDHLRCARLPGRPKTDGSGT